jgi:hypothetical protein
MEGAKRRVRVCPPMLGELRAAHKGDEGAQFPTAPTGPATTDGEICFGGRGRERRCDQALLVRKERKVRSPSRNTEASSSGCESRPIRPARRVGSEPCDGHVGESAEAGRQRARRCVGARASEPCQISHENSSSRGSKASLCPKTTSSTSQNGTGGRRPRRGLGPWRARRRWPSNLGYPCARWEHRRPKTRETKVWAGMRRGSRRGPIGAMTQGNE